MTILCKDGHSKGQKQYGPNRSRRKGGKNTLKNYTKKDLYDLDKHNGVNLKSLEVVRGQSPQGDKKTPQDGANTLGLAKLIGGFQ